MNAYYIKTMSEKKRFFFANVDDKIFGDKQMTIYSKEVAVPYKYS